MPRELIQILEEALLATPKESQATPWCLDIFAAEPMLIKPEVDAWIAAQRLNRLAQAVVAEAMAPLMFW